MQKAARLTGLFLIVMVGLLGRVSGVNWQGTGNLTGYLTEIWTNIEGNIQTYVSTTTTDLAAFATFLSNTYNGLWDNAWNVFVFELLDSKLDAIFVGYSFRDHWLWFNNFEYAGRYFSFVIWKDYNCGVWSTVNNQMRQAAFKESDANHQMYSQYTTALNNLSTPINKFSAFPYDDIWHTQEILVEQLQINNPTKAYSTVAVQDGYISTSDLKTSMNGRFCSDTTNSFIFMRLGQLLSKNGGRGIHKFLVFVTRSK